MLHGITFFHFETYIILMPLKFVKLPHARRETGFRQLTEYVLPFSLQIQAKDSIMAQAKIGDTVRVHYTGKLDDGSVFDSSQDSDPLEFTIGEGEVILGFENAIVGMEPGQKKTVEIPADEAYGFHNEEMIATVDRDQFPEDVQPEIGQQYEMQRDDGESFVMTVTEITDDEVTLDANHPLAGEDLTFDLELMEID